MGIIINGQNDTIGPVDDDMTLLGTVSIGGTMTIEDFTNIDSVGLITARNGLRVDGDYIRVNTNVDSPLDLNVTDDGPIYTSLRRSGTRVAYYGFGGSGSTFNITNEVANGQLIIDTPSHFSVNTNSAERIRVTSAGYVGINEVNPTQQLHVHDDTNYQGILINGSSAPRLTFAKAGSTTVEWGVGIDGTNGNNFAIAQDGNTAKFIIDANGKIGINDNTPDNTLSIKGLGSFDADSNSFYFGSNFTGTGQNYIGSSKHAQRFFLNNSSANGYFSYSNTGSAGTAGDAITWQERFRITSAGDVGIGTDVPIASSGFANLSLAKTNGGQLELKKLSSGRVHYIWGDDNLNIAAAYNGSGDLRVLTNGNNERLRITSDGKMGVGTASPNHRLTLHNSGTGTFDALNITSGLTNSVGLQFGIDSSSNVFFWHTANGAIKFATNNVERIRVTNGGLDPSTDAVSDLGNSSKRYRDLYLSSGVFLGGTSSSNELEDYEEGTFTPTEISGGNLTLTTAAGLYTKVGRMVHIQVRIKYPSTSNTNHARIGGFPFTPSIYGANISNGSNASGIGYCTASFTPQLHMNQSQPYTNFYNFSAIVTNANLSGRELRFGIVYSAA